MSSSPIELGRYAEAETQGDQASPLDTPSCARGDLSLSFLEPPDRPGSLGRLGHYRVCEVLGQGGFGTVLKAYDEVLHRDVAIKVLSPAIPATSPARQRFLREAQAAARIRHENVVQVHAIEKSPLPYLVMEYIPGETLQQRMNSGEPLSVNQIAHIGAQIARGLAAAHELGLIHRDVKPGNVLLEPGEALRAKLSDFGLARAADDAGLTQSGMVCGTPRYMSPEQARGEPIDCRSDLFSLGSVLYAMCLGRPPFRGESSLAVMKQVAEVTPQPIAEILPTVPRWLSDIIARLHARNPGDRFSSAREVAELLEVPRTVGPTGSLPAVPPVPKQSRRTLAVVAGVLLVALLGALGMYVGGRGAPSSDTRGTVVPEVASVPDASPVVVASPVSAAKSSVETTGGELPPKAPARERREPADALECESLPLKLLEKLRVTHSPVPSEVVAVLAPAEGGVRSVAWSPDGRRIAVAGQKDTLSLWDAATGRVFHMWTDPGGSSAGLAFSPDGSLLASGHDSGYVRLWHVATGAERIPRIKFAATGVVRSLAFSPDGTRLFVGRGRGPILAFDLATGRKVAEFPLKNGDPVIVDSHRNHVAAVGYVYPEVVKRGRIWDATTGRLLHTLLEFPLAYSPDGKWLIVGVGAHRSAALYDAARLQELRRLDAPQTVAAQFSADGRRLVTVSGDHLLRVWDTSSWTLEHSLPGGHGPHSQAFSPGGGHLVAMYSGRWALIYRLRNVDATR